ncbi:MAG: NADH-quinone oxidoreductase subunit M [Bacteroidetes bacterium]|nr:NADH-quinone oxidoreductase subunit M [Bacteroidota bacterium]
MLTAFDNFPALLIWLPLLGALLAFFLRREGVAGRWALLSSLITFGVTVASLFFQGAQHYALTQVSYVWLPDIGSSFTLSLDGISWILCLLNAVSFPLILAFSLGSPRDRPHVFYGLMLLAQTGLNGVFLCIDALGFYFFWELALIPVYFLASLWGGERRVQAAFKFFLYTFAGSVLMLAGILWIQMRTADQSFSLASFYRANLDPAEQAWLFWAFFLAFAIKMPIFPFHTWQPDAYEQSDSPVTMVLSGVMVKMGVFALMRWLLPLFPDAFKRFDEWVILLCIVGMVYASCIAMVQDDLKRMVAYSSIAHIGLMAAAVFTVQAEAWHGVLVQMFNHGINIIGLWMVVARIEAQLGVRKISALGGLAQKAPSLAILLTVIALANIALPLTNAFVGEFLMFNGLYRHNPWYAGAAGLSIILSAVYMLNMIRNVFLGGTNTMTENFADISLRHRILLSLIVLTILFCGVHPEPMLSLVEQTSDLILKRVLTR